MNETKKQSEAVATRKTFDGVTVYLHADGSLSTLMHFVKGGKLPLATMWRFLADVCLMTFAELPAAVREEKRGQRKPFAIRDWVRPENQIWAAGPMLANGARLEWRVR